VNKHEEKGRKNERKKEKKEKRKYTDGLLIFSRIFSSRSPKHLHISLGFCLSALVN